MSGSHHILIVDDDQRLRDLLQRFLTEQGFRVTSLPDARELARRLSALSGVELLAALDEAERRKIAERLVPTPFARGDVMTRQGAAAHWLYIIVAGEAEVQDGQQRLHNVYWTVRSGVPFNDGA